jgi:phosphoribosylanthranilate isomerase
MRVMGYHLRIKVCGVTAAADLAEAARLGVDAVGLNFHPASPRSVTADTAVALLRELPPFVEAVGVFVQKSVQEAAALVARMGRIRVLQIHGRPGEMVAAFPYHFVPAFAVREAADVAAVQHYLDACAAVGRSPSAILVDGHAPGLHGGTGRTAPWHLLSRFSPGVPLLLAGGLTLENVADAVRAVRPWGVDVASGVESSPGRKDPERMRRFIEAAREAAWAL